MSRRPHPQQQGLFGPLDEPAPATVAPASFAPELTALA